MIDRRRISVPQALLGGARPRVLVEFSFRAGLLLRLSHSHDHEFNVHCVGRVCAAECSTGVPEGF